MERGALHCGPEWEGLPRQSLGPPQRLVPPPLCTVICPSSWDASPLCRSCGPSLRAVATEAGAGDRAARERAGCEWPAAKTADPALRGVEWGRQGLDPRHLLSPLVAPPAGTGTPTPPPTALRSQGRRVRWAGWWAPAAPALRDYSQGAPASGAPPGAGPYGGGLGKCFKVSRCYQWGRGQGCCSQRTLPLTSCPGHISRALKEMRLSVSVSAPRRPGQASSLPQAPPQPGWCPASLSLLGLCTNRRAPVALWVKSLRVQALGAGAGSWGSPSLCPRLAPVRPALIGHSFSLSFNIFIPTFKMGRKAP